MQVTDTAIAEAPLQSGHNFQSEGSVSVSIFGFENVTRETISPIATKSQESFDNLLNVAFDVVQSKVSKIPPIKAWLTKVGKSIPLSPAVYILNGNETIDDEEFGGPTAELSKPITFTVLSFEFPRAATLRNNIQISDNLVKVIEQNNRLGGYTDDGFVQNVVYGWGSQNDGFHFFSAINAMYNIDKRFKRLIK